MYAALRPPGQARGSRPACRGPALGRFLPSRPAGLRGGPPVAAQRSASPCRPLWPSPRLRPSLRVLGRPPPARVRVAGLKPALGLWLPASALRSFGSLVPGRWPLRSYRCGPPLCRVLRSPRRFPPRPGLPLLPPRGLRCLRFARHLRGARSFPPRGLAAPPCRLLAVARLLRFIFFAPFRPPSGGNAGSRMI